MSKPEHVYETFIRAEANDIWEAITSAAFTRRYFHAMAVKSSWTPGAPVRFVYEDGRTGVEGEVLEADAPTRLVYTWRFVYDEELAKERPSRVAYDIEAMGGVCRLRVTHDDFDPDSKVLPMMSQGWSAILCSLKSLLETGEPLPLAGNGGSDESGAAA